MFRLITFSNLSLLRERQEDGELIASAESRLSAVAAAWDCHLLQSPNAATPLDALGNAQQQRRLEAALSGQRAEVLIVHPRAQSGCHFPAWLNPVMRTVEDPDAIAEVLTSQWAEYDRPALQWLHVDLSDEEKPTRWIAAVLHLAAATALTNTEDTLVVTATGGEQADCGRFESLLWEGVLRVPLWIADRHVECGREHRPTGSFDVLETLLAVFNAGSRSSAIDLRHSRGTVPLETPRRIQIANSGCDAVRTEEFLCVRSRTGDTGQLTALYGKPHDIWNVHDVSHEFPQILNELLSELPHPER